MTFPDPPFLKASNVKPNPPQRSSTLQPFPNPRSPVSSLDDDPARVAMTERLALLLVPPVTQPHVAPEQATKQKTKRTKSSSSNKRKQEQKIAAMERAQKLEKRKNEMGSKKDQRKKAKQMWQ